MSIAKLKECLYRRGKWVRGNDISSKNKVVDVVGRKVWFADKGTYWTVSPDIVFAFFFLSCSFCLYSLHLPMLSAC